MNKAQKIMAAFFVIAIIAIAGLYIAYLNLDPKDNTDNNSTSGSTDIIIKNLEGKNILYYGSSCPHCKVVEEFIQTKNVSAKMSIEQKEVFDNPENLKELQAVAEFCKEDSANLQVPFFYSESDCYVGADNIEGYLTKKLSL